MISKIAGRVRGLFAGNYAENREDEQIVLNNRGEQLVVQGLPPRVELVRLGDSWQIKSTTGQAALTSLPTTVAGLSITNTEPATGKCLIIESFGSSEHVVDATQTDVTALFAMLNRRTPTSASPSGGTAETGFKSFSARNAIDVSVSALRGATVVDDAWFPHGTPGAQMAAAAAGANWKVNEPGDVAGLYLVPPGAAFSVQAVKAAAAAAAQQFFFIRFHATQLIWRP